MSQNQAILESLQRYPGTWVSMPMLVNASGAYAIHSRIAELRKQGHQIENLIERMGRTKKSYYRYVAS